MNGTYYVPTGVLNTPCRIHHAEYEVVNGVNTPCYIPDEKVIFLACKSYGGSEKVVDNQYTIIDTMTFVGYYDPTLKAQDLIEIVKDGTKWEILNTPENVDLRGAFMTFKARRYHG